MQAVRVASDRGLDRIREGAHLGWQVVNIAAGKKAPSFDQYLTLLGLRGKPKLSARRKQAETIRAKRNAARVAALFDRAKQTK